MLLHILTGLIPLAFGCIMNWFMFTFPDIPIPYTFISVGTLVFWFFVAFLTRAYTASTKHLLLRIHLIPFVVLVLLFIQETILKAYWSNPIGLWTQIYYLPLLNLGFTLTPWTHRVFAAYLRAFVLMVIVALGGCYFCKKK